MPSIGRVMTLTQQPATYPQTVIKKRLSKMVNPSEFLEPAKGFEPPTC